MFGMFSGVHEVDTVTDFVPEAASAARFVRMQKVVSWNVREVDSEMDYCSRSA